jgi:steroid delta-isomerase-like uncharacterized protein
MPTKENKKAASQFWKEWNELNGDVAKVRPLLEKYCAPNYIYHHLILGRDLNLEQTIEYLVALVSAFPDNNISIDDMIAEGDKVVIRYTMKATQRGPFRGIPATGKQILVNAICINKDMKGKSVEYWEIPDMLGMLTQLGVVPALKT